METPLETNGPARGHAEGSKRTQFQPGHAGRKKGMGQKPQTSVLLRAMQWAFCQPEAKDKTDGQRACRKMLKESPTTFFQTYIALQKEQAAAEAKAATQPKPAQLGGAEPAKQVYEPPKPEPPPAAPVKPGPILCPACSRRIRCFGLKATPHCPDCKRVRQKAANAPPPSAAPPRLPPLCSRCLEFGFRINDCGACQKLDNPGL